MSGDGVAVANRQAAPGSSMKISSRLRVPGARYRTGGVGRTGAGGRRRVGHAALPERRSRENRTYCRLVSRRRPISSARCSVLQYARSSTVVLVVVVVVVVVVKYIVVVIIITIYGIVVGFVF